jgi:hypothetical protein
MPKFVQVHDIFFVYHFLININFWKCVDPLLIQCFIFLNEKHFKLQPKNHFYIFMFSCIILNYNFS